MKGWQPRPDPAIHDPDRPGLRPHVHEPNRLWPWVFRQSEVWVDYWGNEHEIALMASDYIANVIEFCRGRALRIALIVIGDAAGSAPGLDEMQTSGESQGGSDRGEHDVPGASRVRIADEWLETTVLIRALRDELERRAEVEPAPGGDDR